MALPREAPDHTIGLLAYGSLMHPAELARHGLDPVQCRPVRVRGYRRSFCQEPSWRAAVGDARGVLTVRPAEGEWISALLVPRLPREALPALDRRERGYRRVAVAPAQLEGYEGDAAGAGSEAVLYVGREERFNARILPGERYLELCLRGAAAWGENFYRDFLRSTWVQDRVPLSEHRPELALGG